MATTYENMGYTRQLFYTYPGGTTASTNLTNVTDLNFNKDIAKAETHARGDGSSLPIVTRSPVSRDPKITWSMRDRPNDTHLQILRAAAGAGNPVALVIKEVNSAGAYVTIFDGDVTMTVSDKHGMGDTGGFDFDADATYKLGRLPVF